MHRVCLQSLNILSCVITVVQWKLSEAEHSRHSVASACSSTLLHPPLHSMVHLLDMEIHYHAERV